MAVPKKRTSKSRKNIRKAVWKKKALKQAVQAYFIASLVAAQQASSDISTKAL